MAPPGYEQKSLDKPDERRDFPKGHVDVVQLGGSTIGRSYLEPGWRWSESVKPVVGTEFCEVPHVGFVLSGRLGVRLASGTEFELSVGDTYSILEPHDAWVVGDEVVQGVEFESLKDYAKAE